MAQTNFTPILIYASSTPTNVPSASNLINSATGSELAINIADKNLFFKDSSNIVNTVPIRQSGTSSNGWLSSTDWNTFNNKLSAMVYPGAGIANSTGSAWGTSYSTTGSGTVVALATSPSLTTPTQVSYENWTSIAAPSYLEGRVWYDSTEKALAYYNDSSALAVHISQDLIFKVINNTGSTIPNGSPVYITGTSSGQTYPNVALAKADVAATSSVIGLTNGAIANGAIGYVSSQGTIDNVNTGTFTVGQVLYLSPYSAGQLMNTIPPTGITVQVGIATFINSSTGKIYVKQTTPLAVPASIITGTLGVPNGGTGATTLTGYVKGSGTSALTASATVPTTDLSGTVTNAQLANSAITINGTSTSLGGLISVGTVTSVAALTLGTTGTDLSSSVATGTTTPVITLNVPTASATNRGALSAADWSTFNSKQPAGSYLTAVSIVSANGFAGTSSGGTTPALTLSTSITGLLKGNGTAISAATSGTDYAPATSGSSILYGNGAGGFSNVTVGTGLTFVGGTLASTASGGTVTSVAATVPAFLSIAGSPITTSGTLAITLSGTALPVANGGTGITTTPSNGQIPIGNGTNYTAATLTAGSGISVTNASGSITVANTQNTGPAFSAYANTTQAITSGTFTKVAFQTEEFDTNSNYDNATNYRFLPTVAGYYQITGSINLVTPSTRCFVMIYKNGALYKTSPDIQSTSVGGQTLTSLVYLNGTDYVEFYAFTGTTTSIYGGAGATPYTWFCGAMIRTS